jgi:glycosyltransferase involved in cell wall biosynthesis
MKLSVVMAVYNGERMLAIALESILAQSEPDFELIVVNDGSTDGTASILERYARADARMRVLTQENSGLTQSLIRGCAEARAEVIARHDCDDVSHAERFSRQLTQIEAGHVLVSCTTEFGTPEGDFLFDSRAEGDDVRRSLLEDPVARIRGLPSHGSAMFRHDAYVKAGGYRAQFRVAQDLDLWIRLARLGTISIVEEPLYRGVIDPAGISSTAREAQFALAELAVALRDGGDEGALLRQAASILPSKRRGGARGYYFIARGLMRQKNPRWRTYLGRALIHLLRQPFL